MKKSKIKYKTAGINSTPSIHLQTFISDKSIREDLYLYYAHSFYVDYKSNKNASMYTTHGKVRVPAMIRENNIFGLQFHPELSGKKGEEVFSEYIK